MAVAPKLRHLVAARQFFLGWLREYLAKQGEKDAEVWRALERELWRLEYPARLPSSERLQHVVRWVKKWLLRLEERTLPASIRRWLWQQQRIR